MAFEGEITKYEDDFQFLKEMKDLLTQELLLMKASKGDPTFSDSELKSGIFTETNDGREVRIVLPAGLQLVFDYLTASMSNGTVNQDGDKCNIKKDLCFVGFIGDKSELAKTSEELLKEVMATDVKMLKELPEVEGMIAYLSGERTKGGDYGNLVLFRDRAVLSNLFKSRNHFTAVSSLSPRFYNQVRIHSGTLPDGLTSSFFVLQKTLFLQYTLPPDDPGRRRVQMWRACREDSEFVKVLPRAQGVSGL